VDLLRYRFFLSAFLRSLLDELEATGKLSTTGGSVSDSAHLVTTSRFMHSGKPTIEEFGVGGHGIVDHNVSSWINTMAGVEAGIMQGMEDYANNAGSPVPPMYRKMEKQHSKDVFGF